MLNHGRADIKITFKCNNRCDFCAQGNKRDSFTERPTSRIKADLLDAKEKGATAVTFTGGEPTLHKDLVPLVEYARSIGYTDVQIQTNGRTFVYADLLLQLKDAGATNLSPSLHGYKPETHDSLTHSKGSFLQTVAGIKKARELGFEISTNTVVTSKNYREFPDMSALFISLGVTQFQFAFVHIVGTALVNKDWLVPKKTTVLPYIKKALDIGIKYDVPCYTEAIPFCLMKGYEQCIAEQIIPEGPVFDGELHLENYADYRKNIGKVKAPSCKTCFYFNKCEGPWKEYPELYGWEEFKPVK